MNNTLSPQERYRQDLASEGFVADAGQATAVDELQRIHDALLADAQPQKGFGGWLSSRLGTGARGPVRGLYLWGGVGRGKTHVVNAFHESLPFENKMRVHFFRFMQRVHAELNTLTGQSDPLQIVADRLAKQTRVLTFDEFHVSDITDAMLLGRLFGALFERRVTLVTTSNIHPDGLYSGGLQRARFLPAIELLKQHTMVMELGGATDYRLRVLEQAEIYHSPLDEAANISLQRSFEAIADDAGTQGGVVRVLGRDVASVRVAEGVIWFDFDALCDGPRGAADYIEIAREFHTVLVSNVPEMGVGDNDRALRFVMMVDEFYDRSVNLVMSAATPPESMYVGERHAFAFERTASRLIEMRSKEYLHRPHVP
jgi:cell division protein ZapE